MSPGLILDNYINIFTSKVYLDTYLNTFKLVALVWAIALLVAYPMAYFLTFHVPSLRWQAILFVICTVPFFTSNIIRMISWIPFLGREGLVNQALMAMGLIN